MRKNMFLLEYDSGLFLRPPTRDPIKLNNEQFYIPFPRLRLQTSRLNLLQPTGYVTHQQFNIQQLYALPTLYLCVLYLSENKQRLVPLTA